MPDHRIQHSEAQKILERARRLLAETANGRQEDGQYGRQSDQSWITILFLRIQIPGMSRDDKVSNEDNTLAQYKDIVVQEMAEHSGHLLAEAADTVLALFSSPQQGRPSESGVRAAVRIMELVAAMNKQRLAQDLVPFRVGIGIDAGAIESTAQTEAETAGAHLEKHIRLAKGLSDLNQQTPFPAIFISESMAAGLVERNGYHIQNLGDVSLPKQREPIAVYALFHTSQSQAA